MPFKFVLLLALWWQIATKELPLQFGVISDGKERKIKTQLKMCFIRSKMVEKKAVDPRRVPIADFFASQVDQPQSREQVPYSADGNIRMIVRER